MSQIVRFIDGPIDQQLRTVPDNMDMWVVVEEFDEPTLDNITNPPREIGTVKIKKHIYMRAFTESAYFKYQGVAGEPIEA